MLYFPHTQQHVVDTKTKRPLYIDVIRTVLAPNGPAFFGFLHTEQALMSAAYATKARNSVR